MFVHPWQLRQAARCIRSGGLIAYPTEAVFGLGCEPLHYTAVQRLLALKRRPVEKGLILIASDYTQLRPFLRELSSERMEAIFATWPGPATWLLPAAPETPTWLTGRHDSIAVRVTAHPIAAALCHAYGGPLISTSANLSGHTPARRAFEVQQQFGGDIDFILNGPVGSLKQPTPIRDARDGRLLRA